MTTTVVYLLSQIYISQSERKKRVKSVRLAQTRKSFLLYRLWIYGQNNPWHTHTDALTTISASKQIIDVFYIWIVHFSVRTYTDGRHYHKGAQIECHFFVSESPLIANGNSPRGESFELLAHKYLPKHLCSFLLFPNFKNIAHSLRMESMQRIDSV